MLIFNRYYATEVSQASIDQLFLKDGNPNKFSVQMPTDKVFLLQLANGLEFIHSKQLVHGDIRPENVHMFPCSTGLPAVIKWAGFALFKPLCKREASYSVSELKGSLNWMAPELLKVLLEGMLRPSTAGVNLELADVFSAGCTIFFYLTRGHHAFGTDSAIITNIQNSNALLIESELYF